MVIMSLLSAIKIKSLKNLDEVMVEVLCLLGKDGPKPYYVGKIGTYHKSLIEQQYAYRKINC